MAEKKKETFLHRLFAQLPDDPWAERWPAPRFVPWDGGSSTEEDHGELDQSEMKRIAASCDKAILRKILKFGNENAQLEALQNPSLELEDIIDLASRAKTGGVVLSYIGRNRNWSGDPRVARELCNNPKTPYFVSRNLLSYLQVSELREIAKNPLAPPALQKDARVTIENKTK